MLTATVGTSSAGNSNKLLNKLTSMMHARFFVAVLHAKAKLVGLYACSALLPFFFLQYAWLAVGVHKCQGVLLSHTM
jgi:hypothetical protein